MHVAGIQAFLDTAKSYGHETHFLGPAVPLDRLVEEITRRSPDMVALSYRLTPENAEALLKELKSSVDASADLRKPKYLFGGTPPVAAVARRSGLFAEVFDGNEPPGAVVEALQGPKGPGQLAVSSSDLVERIAVSFPFPLIRHHFGLPTVKETVEGARKLAEAKVLDILSIAPDQNAQESFFRPVDMDPRFDGAGGVPLRSPDNLKEIREATRTGNHPLLRCYSGTRDLIRWGEMLEDTIDIAWGAVPLMWYSQLDGRSKRPLRDAIAENQEAIRWYAQRGIPVEVNESHQWALRRCGDTIELATAYIAAHNAKALGVKHYVAQFMFDTPRGVSPAMDMAKMLAKVELVESLASEDFKVIRMMRTGLSSLSTSPSTAKGQLASSVFCAMAIGPHIVHVVGFSEADHAAKPEEIIESCEIARGAIGKALAGIPRPESDPAVAARKALLISETKLLIDMVKRSGVSPDPLTSPDVLYAAVRDGVLDAPELKGGGVAHGRIVTRIVDGACVAVDPSSGKPLTEKERLSVLAPSEEDLDLAEI